MIAIAFSDLANMIIPNGSFCPAPLPVWRPRSPWTLKGGGCIWRPPSGAALFLFLLALIWRGGMGAEDVMMASLIATVLGSLVVVAMFDLHPARSSASGLSREALITLLDVIPFGTYLALESLRALLFGPAMVTTGGSSAQAGASRFRASPGPLAGGDRFAD